MRADATRIDWQGFYVGGQFSYSDGNADFSKSTQDPIAFSLRQTTLEATFAPSNWPVLGAPTNHSAAGFGGFVGYNISVPRADRADRVWRSRRTGTSLAFAATRRIRRSPA